MEEILCGITKWNDKKPNKVNDMKIVNDNTLTMTYLSDDIKVKINSDSTYEVEFTRENTNMTTNGLIAINMYAITKPSFYKLIGKMTKIMELIPKKSDDENNEPIREFTEYDKRKLKEDLKTYEGISVSPLTIDTKKDEPLKIFDKSTVRELIVDEYISTFETFLNDPRINVSLIEYNIYHWKIEMKNFSSDKLTKSLKNIKPVYGYNHIELELSFHESIYPNYPVNVNVIRPLLGNSLIKQISNMQMISFEYWNTSRTVVYILNKIHDAINKHGIIIEDTELNDPKKYPSGAMMPIEIHLTKLESLFGQSTINTLHLDDTKYSSNKKNPTKNIVQNTTKNNAVWKSGTGYGTSAVSCTKWDVNSYVELQKEKDQQIINVLKKIVNEMGMFSPHQLHVMYGIIKNSCLITYIKSLLSGISLLEMEKHDDVHKIICQILQHLVVSEAMFLYDIAGTGRSLYDVLTELSNVIGVAQKMSKGEIGETPSMYLMIYDMIKTPFKEYLLLKEKEKEKEKVTQNKTNSSWIKYAEIMEDLKFDEAPIVGTNYKYQEMYESNLSTPVKYQKRLVQEFTSLMQSLPIHYNASIFVRNDPDNLCALRILITGPEDTPYEGGCFIFDMYIQPTYPKGPPKIILLNTGGDRFNPNLYACGKVCLSILGTWDGDPSENWIPNNSTLYQILVSIQGQIMVEEPYYNEPGYEKRNSKETSNNYNMNIRYYTMKNAMLGLLQNPDKYPQYTKVIQKHFFLQRDKIKSLCKAWVDKATSSHKAQYKSTYASLVTELDKLHFDL